MAAKSVKKTARRVRRKPGNVRLVKKNMKKRNSVRAIEKSPRRKRDSVEDLPEPVESGHQWELLGLGLIAAAIIASISLISHFVQGDNDNILGKYVGTWLARSLNMFTGSLPSILLIATILALGIKFIQHRPQTFNFKLPIVTGVLYFLTSVLLSIKNITTVNLEMSHFEQSGGFIGNFIVHQTLIPVFGRTVFGPYLVCSLIIIFTLIWGFKLRISQVIEKSVEFGGIFLFPVFDGLESAKAKRAAKLGLLPEVQGASDSSPNRGSEIDTEHTTTPVRSQKKAGKEPEMEIEVPVRSIKIIEDMEQDLENETGDPLEIRKKRDKLKELKRIAELNEWEVQQRNPTIGGLVTKKARKKKEPARSNENVPVAHTREEPVLEKISEELEPETVQKTEIRNHVTETLADPVEDGIENEEEIEEIVVDEMEEDSIEDESPELEPEPEPEPEPEIQYDDYKIPEINAVLEDPPVQVLSYTEESLKGQARMLEEQLANFKVMGKVVGICSGPVIIRYEVELAPGVKVNQIAGLSDDLAMALRAKSIRILAPIPGKSAVGIEVPNKDPQIVYIKELLASSMFNVEPDTIKLILGKDIAGEPCVMDLTKAPHLLIAGQTGSGKSVCINSFMTSMLCSKTPDEVRMILVDPKVVELKPYNNIPHLLSPVITQPEMAVQALKWATYEMDYRYELLSRAGVRNIKGFNQKFRAGKLENKLKEKENRLLPFIIIIIDELADLMMVSGKEVETNIARIAQKARAVGVHLILATQRPSTNVITGTIKANLPTRVAFQVASQIDARTIMDKAGCEKLLGRGDMLFRSIDSPDPERIHGAFIGDDETEALANACAGQFVNYPHIPTFDLESEGFEAEEEDIPRDAKFREAAELLVSIRQASVSLLQRRMAIGYARAGRLMDQLSRAGIVGPERGSKPREVLMDELELQSFLSSGLND